MRLAVHPPHRPGASRSRLGSARPDPAAGPFPRQNRPCYIFNPQLERKKDDRACEHCRYYLTPRCPHLDEFLEDLEEGSED